MSDQTSGKGIDEGGKNGGKSGPWADVFQGKVKLIGLRRYVYPGHKKDLIYLHVKIQGKSYTECTNTTKVEAAKAFLGEFRRKIERQVAEPAPVLAGVADPGKITMRECHRLWRERLNNDPLKALTLLRKDSMWNGFLESWAAVPAFKGAKLTDFKACAPRDISFDHLLKWRTDALGAQGYAPDSVNKVKGMLEELFAVAIEARAILDNPAEKLSRAAKSTEEVVIPAHDELPKIANAIVENRSKDFMWFLAYTGLRLNEANHVRKCDVHWERGNGQGEIWVSPENTKGRKGREKGRWVPIFPQIRAMIQRRCDKAGSEGWLFDRPGFNIKKGLRQACKDAGVRDYTHHAFRHYFATNLLQYYNVRDAAEILGHRDGGQLLLHTYAHYMPSNIASKQAGVRFGSLSLPDDAQVGGPVTPTPLPPPPENVVPIPEEDRLIAEISALAKRLTPEQRAKLGFLEQMQ